MAASSASGNKSMLKPVTRFDALDGIRGVAALAVMAYHYTKCGSLRMLLGAEAAVDLFFMLSGFVLMHSYGGKIARGMRFREFLGARAAAGALVRDRLAAGPGRRTDSHRARCR